jgi:hypothetical protein
MGFTLHRGFESRPLRFANALQMATAGTLNCGPSDNEIVTDCPPLHGTPAHQPQHQSFPGWQLDAHQCSAPARAVDSQPAIERRDAIRKSSQTPSSVNRGSAAAVVAHLQHQGWAVPLHREIDPRSLRMPHHVRQRLRDNEVRGRLDGRIQSADGALTKRDRGLRSARKGLQGGHQATFGQERRMQPASQGAQLRSAGAQFLDGLLEGPRQRRVRARPELPHGRAERHLDHRQTLLRPIMEVALKSPPGFVGRQHNSCPRRADLLELHLELGPEPGVLRCQPPSLFEALAQCLFSEHAVGDVLTGTEHADRPSIG